MMNKIVNRAFDRRKIDLCNLISFTGTITVSAIKSLQLSTLFE